MEEKKIIALGRSWKLATRRNNISLGLHEEILSRVINQVEREFKRAGDNDKHAICAPLLLSLLALLPSFLQQMAVLYNWRRQKLWAFLSWLSTERPAAIHPPKAVYMALGSFYC